MAHIKSKSLFFTTSPRTPAKMIPEIKLLNDNFSGKEWNKATQVAFIDKLAEEDFFKGTGSPLNKDLSARDRINRAPKALGFVNLKPHIELTDAGESFLSDKRPQEIFLRQLLKFQLPSPFHTEKSDTTGIFFIRPYLEIMRLVRELEGLSFDELKIFGLQLTNYKNFDNIKSKILSFRQEKASRKGEYKRLVDEKWTEAILSIYQVDIRKGNTKTRQTNDDSLKKFIRTKKSNMRDYADACFRYLRYTELVTISHKNRTISFFADKTKEVDFILSTIDRNPVHINETAKFKTYLFSPLTPTLYTDNRDNLVDNLMRIGSFTKKELAAKSITELKNLQDEIIQEKKNAVIDAKIKEIKSYALYSEIIDTYNEIISDGYYDAPLMLEYNTWRAMTMLNGGCIKGNFKFDDFGQPLSTAQGNMPDIECDYNDYVLSVEVTLQAGQRQYEAEGEPVARHYGQLKKRTGKDAYCVFVAPTVNPASLAHFFHLNKTNISYYGGKSKIIPLDLGQFMRLVENSYNYTSQPVPNDIRLFLDSIINKVELASDECEWAENIQSCVDAWLVS